MEKTLEALKEALDKIEAEQKRLEEALKKKDEEDELQSLRD